jgi:hypothetical protein
MSNQNDQSLIPVAAIVAGIIILATLWKASVILNLDIRTAAQVLLLTLFVVLLYLSALYASSREDWDIPIRISFWSTLPIVCALVWCIWWPALDYWSLHASTLPEPTADSFAMAPPDQQSTQWFAKWYSKAAGIILILSTYLLGNLRGDK